MKKDRGTGSRLLRTRLLATPKSERLIHRRGVSTTPCGSGTLRWGEATDEPARGYARPTGTANHPTACGAVTLTSLGPCQTLTALMAEPKENPLMEKIVSLCKRRGFIFQSSEIYGGINGFWDYGPLGAELKRNLRDAWWQVMMREREDVVALDASIIMHRAVWKAIGHEDTVADPMSTCKSCKKLIRADQW